MKTEAKELKATELTSKNMYEYGISVIEDRAIPDYRDGLKPVQRRLLRTADDLHAYANNKTIKSARITGDSMVHWLQWSIQNMRRFMVKETGEI